MYFKVRNSVALVSIVVLASCGDSEVSNEEKDVITTVSVPSFPQVCWLDENYDPLTSGSVPPLCVSYRNADGEHVTSQVTGYKHQFGQNSTMRIRIKAIQNPAPDGPFYHYDLIEILESTQDELGSKYLFEDFPLVRKPFEIDDDGDYSIKPYKFLCGEGVDCDKLIDMGESGGLIFFEFTLTGGDIPITLTRWG